MSVGDRWAKARRGSLVSHHLKLLGRAGKGLGVHQVAARPFWTASSSLRLRRARACIPVSDVGAGPRIFTAKGQATWDRIAAAAAALIFERPIDGITWDDVQGAAAVNASQPCRGCQRRPAPGCRQRAISLLDPVWLPIAASVDLQRCFALTGSGR
jgi:hypothetical protein